MYVSSSSYDMHVSSSSYDTHACIGSGGALARFCLPWPGESVLKRHFFLNFFFCSGGALARFCLRSVGTSGPRMGSPLADPGNSPDLRFVKQVTKCNMC